MDDPKYFEEKRELLYSLKETQVNFKNSTSKFKTEILTP